MKNKEMTIEAALKMYPPTAEQQMVLDSGHKPSVSGVLIELFARAMNTDPETKEEWKADWAKKSQRKWMPVFYMDDNNGFSFDFSDCYVTSSSVGSRHCFEDEASSDYAAKAILDTWKDFIIQ